MNDNSRNLPPQFLVDCLLGRGYMTVPALAVELGCSISWVRKLIKTKLHGRAGDLPKVITTGGARGGACFWVLVSAAREVTS